MKHYRIEITQLFIIFEFFNLKNFYKLWQIANASWSKKCSIRVRFNSNIYLR